MDEWKGCGSKVCRIYYYVLMNKEESAKKEEHLKVV